MKTARKLWIGLGILVLLSPLGILLPAYFKAGGAWGEWKMEKFPARWHAPLPDYVVKGSADKGAGAMSVSYIVSAALGILVVVVIVVIIGKALSKHEK